MLLSTSPDEPVHGSEVTVSSSGFVVAGTSSVAARMPVPDLVGIDAMPMRDFAGLQQVMNGGDGAAPAATVVAGGHVPVSLAKPAAFGMALQLQRGDFFYMRCTGGGGYGDPIERDPTIVVADVQRDFISKEWARRIYGVVVAGDGAGPDELATEACRREIVKRRLRKATPNGSERPNGNAKRIARWGEYGELVEQGRRARGGRA